MLSLEQILEAKQQGKRVFWASYGYEVLLAEGKDPTEPLNYFIKYMPNGSCQGLTWLDGKTVNGKAEDFFVMGELSPPICPVVLTAINEKYTQGVEILKFRVLKEGYFKQQLLMDYRFDNTTHTLVLHETKSKRPFYTDWVFGLKALFGIKDEDDQNNL